MIPQEKSAAVTRGVRDAFGVSEFDDIQQITKGHTNSLVFRIVVRGTPYLLKIIVRAEDPTRHYACMEAAAEAGVAPRVWHTNVEDKISITDYVVAEPLARREARVRVPALLRTLHALAPFGRAPFNTTCTFLLHRGAGLTRGPMLEGFLQKFRGDKMLPDAECEELFARYAEVSAVYPYEDAEMVASHNDLLKPDNLLFDGQRLWLVDWEAAFLNDRYVDLAMAANQLVANEEHEKVFLGAYFGAAPDAYQSARFHLMQQVSHMFYAMAFLSMGSGGVPIDWSVAAPGYQEFQLRWWDGEVNLRHQEVKLAYGRVHWERLLWNVRQSRYKEALQIVADGGR